MTERRATTIIAEVHSILTEKFANEQQFCTADVLTAAPWLANEREDRKSNRVSAALCQLQAAGAVRLYRRAGSMNLWVTNAELLATWKPTVKNRALGGHRNNPGSPRALKLSPDCRAALREIQKEIYELSETALALATNLEELRQRVFAIETRETKTCPNVKV